MSSYILSSVAASFIKGHLVALQRFTILSTLASALS